jgi:hypothetical protein
VCRPHLLRLYTRAEVEERSMARRERPEGTPLVRALALHGVSGDSGSHLGSTLKPGGAVLTLGVFRRSRSVACIRADASPSEVHVTPVNLCWQRHNTASTQHLSGRRKDSPELGVHPSYD